MCTYYKRWIISIILFALLVVLSCNYNKTDSNTSLLLGRVIINVDASKLVFCTSEGNIGVWDIFNNKPIKKCSIHNHNIVGLFNIPDTNNVLVVSNEVNRDKSYAEIFYRQLLIFNINSFNIENRLISPPASSCIFCYITHNIFAQVCFKDANSQYGPVYLSVNKIDNNKLTEISKYSPALRDSTISCIRRVDDHTLLLHLGHQNLKSKNKDNTNNELIVFDIKTNKVVSQNSTNVDALYNPFGVNVSSNGKYAIVHSSNLIELRKLPSLDLVKEIVPITPSRSKATISNDGRYAAFGDSCLAMWDTVTNEVLILDRLKSSIVDSNSIKIPEEYNNSPLTTADAYRQLCLASIEYNNSNNQLYAVTHDGIFFNWDLSKRKLLGRKIITQVKYMGQNIK